MVSTLLITDLDGTLGASDTEIVRGLAQLAQVARRVTMCILTGRSLSALRALASHIEPGTRVAPWGGGNLLRFTGCDYVGTLPRNVVPHTHEPDAPHYIAVPRIACISADDEVHLRPGQEAPGCDVVAGYWRFDAGEGDAALRFARARGLFVSRGRDHLWVNMGPVPSPRLHTVRECRAQTGAERVIYLGDSEPDAECITAVDLFCAPCDSVLVGDRRVKPFPNIETLLRAHLAVV
jgi:hypothetical protein